MPDSKPGPHPLRSLTISSFFPVAVCLFGFVACGSPASNAFFGAEQGGREASGGESDGGAAGTAALAGSGGSQGGSVGTGGSSDGGAAGTLSNGGTASGGTAGSAAGGAENGGTGGTSLGDCSAFGAGASYYPGTNHCYLVVHELATFSQAKNHCTSLGAHLVTLSDQQENDFVWNLDANEHWLGATDGKDIKEPGAGQYAWVDGEPFTYTDWTAGQPNAVQATCSNGGGDNCYEHCAFQWSQGDAPGEWNDRLCTHTIAAVCEWEK